MTTKKKKGFFKRKGVIITISVVALVIIIRLILPYVVLKYANKTLSEMKGYNGHVRDIDLALIRGAYKIKDIHINKLDTISGKETEFFAANLIDLSVEWSALFEGKIVGELTFEDALLIFTKEKVEPQQIAQDTASFRALLRDFMPLRVNRFEVHNGTIKYKDHGSKPPVDIQMSNTYILAQNLRTEKTTDILPSTLEASANIYGGILDLHMKLDPLAEDPTFDLNAELQNTNLPELNDFFKAYGKFDVNKGTFGLFTEIAAKEGKFKGYVKPLIHDLDILGAEDRSDNILQKLWEAIVGGAGVVLRNQPKDQVATKVPLEGNFKNTKADIWYAVLEVLRNAFIHALQPSIDHEINITSVSAEPAAPEEKKGLLKKLFNKKDKKEEEKKGEKK